MNVTSKQVNCKSWEELRPCGLRREDKTLVTGGQRTRKEIILIAISFLPL